MSQLESYIKDYEKSLIRREVSPRTISSYNWAFRNFQKTIGDEDISKESLEDWQDSMMDQKLSPRSRSLAITAIKQLILWGADRDIFNYKLSKALVKVKVPESNPHPIKKSDLFKIKAYLLLNPKESFLILRDKALFFYFLTTGARVSEVLQVQRDNYENCIVIQKGRSEKTLTS